MLVVAHQAPVIAHRCPVNARTISTRLATIATVAAAIAAAAGVFVGGLYRDTPYWIEQARGTDLATLFVAVPVLATGLWAMRRGSESAWLVVIAGLLYLAYNYAIFAFSVAMNPLTSLYIAIAGLATWSLLAGAMDGATVSAGQVVAERMARRTSAVVLVGVALLFTLLWLGQLGGSVASGTVPPDIARAGIPTNPVYALDLAFFLPLAAVAGRGLLRGGRAGAYAFTMLIWVPLMSAGILGGFVLAAAAGGEVPLPVVAVVGGVGAVSAMAAVVPVVRRSTVEPRTASRAVA